MIETKILEVQEVGRQIIVNDMQCFGWQVLSTQKIDYTTTYKTGGGNARTGYNYTVHNDRTAYYSITFQRDTSIKNYSKLNNLFVEYERLSTEQAALKFSKGHVAFIIFLMLFLIGFFSDLIINISDLLNYDFDAFLITFLIVCLPWLVLMILFSVIASQSKKRYINKFTALQRQKEKVVDDAKNLSTSNGQ